MHFWRIITFFVVILTSASSFAQTNKIEVIKMIVDTAERLCGNVEQKGSSDSTIVEGEVKAELSGLAKRLADIGIGGVGKLEESQYQGVLREQLAETLKDVRRC
jgi:hypothetical protein